MALDKKNAAEIAAEILAAGADITDAVTVEAYVNAAGRRREHIVALKAERDGYVAKVKAARDDEVEAARWGARAASVDEQVALYEGRSGARRTAVK